MNNRFPKKLVLGIVILNIILFSVQVVFANGGNNQQVTICHVNPAQGIVITVSQNALKGHMNNNGALHGSDFFVNNEEDRIRCENIGQPTETPTVEPTETETPTVEPTETETPTVEPTETETPTVEPTETETPTVEPTETETPTVEPTETETPTVEPTPDDCDFRVLAGDVADLKAKIDLANANGDHSVICLGGGTYNIGAAYAGDTAYPILATSMEFLGNGSVLSSSAAGFRMFTVTSTLVMSNLSIENANLAGNGGAFFVNAGSLSLNLVTISNNQATNGGGIYVSAGSVSLNAVDFSGNIAGSGGGAIRTSSAATVNIANSSFQNNQASTGGAIANFGSTVNLNTSQVTQNTANTAGGIYNDSFGTVFVQNTALQTNTSVFYGAALATDGSTMTINFSCIVGNNNSTGSDVVKTTGGALMNAENNWWGAATGPNTSGADTASTNVDFTPWLIEPLGICLP